MLRKIVSHLPIILILIFAAILRLYRIADYMTFLGDEGRDVLVAYNILHGHLTLLGPTASVGGFFFGPLYYYMMAPFLLLFQYNPVGPAVMIALFGVATVWLVYKLGETIFSKPVGIIAAFLYATAPLIISYSRSSWNPNPIPFFACLLILLLYKAVVDKKRVPFITHFLVGLLWGILVELHFVTGVLLLVIFPYIAIIYLLQKRPTWRKDFFISVAIVLSGFLVGMLPYLGFELRHNFPNVRSFVSFIFFSGKVGAEGGNGFLTLGNVMLRLFGRILLDAPAIEKVQTVTKDLVLAYIFPAILAGVSLIVFAQQLKKSIQDKEQKLAERYLLLAIWFIGGIIIFAFYHKPIYDYYFGFMYAVPFLLAANLVGVLFQKGLGFKIVSLILFILFIVPNIKGVPFQFTGNKQLAQTETIAKAVFDMTGGKPYNFALITSGNSDHAYRYFLTLWGRPPVTIENSVVDPQRKTVTGQLLVVCESIPCSPLGVSLWEVAGFGRAEVAEKKLVVVYDVYKLVHYTPSVLH